MIKGYLQGFKKYETKLLAALLYGVLLVYLFQFFRIADHYKPFTTDEFFYYLEAKAISAHNIYHTPASLDGNTSFIGNFGFHGVSYAIKDGWLAKLFFHSEHPPLVWNNFLVCVLTILLIVLFKPFSLNNRLKISLIVATHYILYSYTLSYMQETIHYFFAVLALEMMYLMYLQPANSKTKYLYYFVAILIVSITFRYGWFIWGLGLLPFSSNLKSFIKWSVVAVFIMAWGIFISRYIAAPYPYDNMMADKLIRAENFSVFNAIKMVGERFWNNFLTFISPAESTTTTAMRYLMLGLLISNTYFSITKKNRFTIACTFIGWGYLLATLAFYFVHWSYDERTMAVLNPLLAFSTIVTNHSVLFYPIITVQLFFFPAVIKQTNERNDAAVAINQSSPEKESREATYLKIKDLITDEEETVVAVGLLFVRHGAPDSFLKLPLVNAKGFPIHYRVFLEGQDLRQNQKIKYVLNFDNVAPNAPNQLIYADNAMHFFKITN